MCVIVFKPRKAKLDVETLRRCFTANSDGAGFMWRDDEYVNIRKGFMTFDDLIQALKNEGFMDGDALRVDEEIAIHCRIATSGGVAPGRTHPFPVHRSYKMLELTSYRTKIAVMHNGIIYSLGGLDWSDTQEFVSTYLHHCLHTGVSAPEIDTILNDYTGSLYTSKFLIMMPENVFRVGGFAAEEGVHYSNTIFRIMPSATTYLDGHLQPMGNFYHHGWDEEDWHYGYADQIVEKVVSPKPVNYATPYGKIHLKLIPSCHEETNCTECKFFAYDSEWAVCQPWERYKATARMHLPHLSKQNGD